MELLEYSVDGAVVLIRLNRPPVNAISNEVTHELAEAFENASDPGIRAAVIWGEPHFSTGADIKGFVAHQKEGSGEQYDIPLRAAIRKFEQLAKPTFAAVYGYALGGGLELAVVADFRYLASDAQVGQPEINLGLIPGAGGTQRLTRLVGVSKARDIVYSGRFVPADEALAIGLADRVADPDELLDVTLEDAARYAKGPTLGLAAAKRAINDGWGRPIDEAVAVEEQAFNDVFWTEDAEAGVAAFITKESPEFTGR
ncbi:MAG: enoyl-CoA hydratase/isomerase family protein [Acidimicrobiia bacterium]